MSNKLDRNTSIEILRIVLMIAIFIWHILVHGYMLKDIGSENIVASNTQLVLLALLAPATYCFMFISGYYGISYSHKRFAYIVFLCYFAVFISFTIRYFAGIPTSILSSFFPLTREPWWFIHIYLIIMVLSPIINRGIELLTKKQFRFIVAVMLYFLVASMLQFRINNGSNILGLLTIYLLARYIRIHDIKLSLKQSFVHWFMSFLLLSVALLVLNLFLAKAVFIFLSYCNPLIIIMAISIFFITLNLPQSCNRKINKLFSPVLMIYLITEFLGVHFYKKVAEILDSDLMLGWGVVLIVIVLCVLCVFVGHVANTLFDFCCKKIIE